MHHLTLMQTGLIIYFVGMGITIIAMIWGRDKKSTQTPRQTLTAWVLMAAGGVVGYLLAHAAAKI